MAGKLTARQVATLKEPGKHGDGRGLWLRVRPDGRRGWVFRYRFRGRDREMGLGSADEVALREAREQAVSARQLLREGRDPIEESRKKRAAARGVPSFAGCAEAFLAANETAWRNPKHRQQWRNTLGAYVFPAFGESPVDSISMDDVLRVVQPLWQAKPETASRIRGRVERILDWARARGLRDGENPARWRGHLDQLLPSRAKVRPVRHFAALPWRDIPAFMESLHRRQGIAAGALEFAILTAARSGEVRGARWREIDGDTWVIPAERMKARREHRVPLSPRALAILDEMRRFGSEPVQLVFPGIRTGKPMSDMTLGAVLKRMGRHDATAHGFRSSFRDWAAEATSFPREVCEQALAHTLANKVEAAYRRGDLFEKRRQLMTVWSAYCEQPPGAKLVEFPA